MIRCLTAASVLSCVASMSGSAWSDDVPRPKPLKVLLVTGGPFHDYKKQEQILTEGAKARANVEWTVVREGDSSTNHKIELFDKPGWAEGYDLVVHNECYADADDPAYVKKLVEVHRAGVPAVVVHCAMHTFRALKTDDWHEFLGVTTFRHGPQHPLAIKPVEVGHPIMQGFPKEGWTTGNEELYWIDKIWPETTPLAEATENTGKTFPVLWVHQYGKARVFGTTIPHNHSTMADPVFLDLFARGMLWATNKIEADGKPSPGYGPPPSTSAPKATSGELAPGSDRFIVQGTAPRPADSDAPLAEGWPGATAPGRIEIKSYPAYRGAVARAKNGQVGGDDALFYPLFLHITRSDVAMTAPVVCTYDSSMIADKARSGDVAMEFVYRTADVGATGRGVGAVTVVDHPASTFASLGVQGRLDPDRFREAVETIRSWLGEVPRDGQWVESGDPRKLGYHPPMADPSTRLWEVQIPLKPAHPVDSKSTIGSP